MLRISDSGPRVAETLDQIAMDVRRDRTAIARTAEECVIEAIIRNNQTSSHATARRTRRHCCGGIIIEEDDQVYRRGLAAAIRSARDSFLDRN